VVAGEDETDARPVPAGAVVPAAVGPAVPPPTGVVPAAPVGPAPAAPVTPVWGAQPDRKQLDPKQSDAKQPDPKAQPLPQPLPLPGLAPDPKSPDPKAGNLPGDPAGPIGGGAAGDPAADYLRALESAQVGYQLKIEQAVELGVLNARELQDRREDLYLAALPVTLERFNFTTMAFFTEQAVLQSTGRELANGGELWNLGTTASVRKLFPTGALLTARLANQVIIDLSGDRPTTTISNLALSLAQPFLRGGGRAVTLEPLTQTERNLVYAMRSYMRFRRLFFVAIAAGPTTPLGYTNNPYGLQGLSANLGRGVGNNLTAPNVGYLPLLLQMALVSNQRKNVAELERLLRLYQAYREGGQLAPLQVDQLEVQLLTSRGQLLGQATGAGGIGGSGIRGFLDALDNFKLQLGLPLTVPLELNDGPLRPIYQQLGRLEEVSAQARALDAEAERFDPAQPVGDFRARWRALLTTAPLVRGTPFARTIAARWDTWSPAGLPQDQFDARMAALRAERQKLLDARADRQVKGTPEPEAEVRRLEGLNNDIDLGEFERAVRAYEAQPWLKKGQTFVPQRVAYNAVYGAFQLLVIEARNERQAIVRGLWPQLPPLPVEGGNILEATLDEAYALGVQTALTNRLDLMNARAQVVDAWRQIAVTANSLQGVFNVQYDLNSGTPAGGNSPFAFSGARSTNQVTFNAQLPLVRRAERNNYRAALIAYQRQRRTLMAFEDNIANDVRSDMRDLRTFAQLYRIQQRVVELGYSQVDNAQLTQFAPLSAGVTLDAAAQAALTQQVLTTQSNLVSAQNVLFQLWVSYQTARMSLYLDLEQMPLDDRGVWTDEFFNRTDRQDRPDLRQPGERLPAPRPLPDNNPGQRP
jgi:hypothetical protein